MFLHSSPSYFSTQLSICLLAQPVPVPSQDASGRVQAPVYAMFYLLPSHFWLAILLPPPFPLLSLDLFVALFSISPFAFKLSCRTCASVASLFESRETD